MNDTLRDVSVFSLILAVLLSVLIISGCTITLVSKYDEQTDANVTALQKKLDAYLLKLDGAAYPDCSFASNKSFYDGVHIQLGSAQVRANAIPQNDITIQQLDALSKAIADLEKIQKLRDGNSSCLPAEIIKVDRTLFNSIFTAILKFELAKKRGEAN